MHRIHEQPGAPELDLATTTNVHPAQLNYSHYQLGQYDRDIVNSIPGHRKLHGYISAFLQHRFDPGQRYDLIDLGVGTGITAQLIHRTLPKSALDVVDFSPTMLEGAKQKLGDLDVRYIFGDYALLDFGKHYHIVSSVIGIHHQNNAGKRALFKKIYGMLNPNGVFIFGDLVTYRDHKTAALNLAKHFHHLVENAIDEQTLAEWAYHHIKQNDLAPLEDQLEWLTESGFNPKVLMTEINTALIVASK